MTRKRILLGIVGILVIGFVVLQLIPASAISSRYAAPGNPEVTYTIQWDSAETEQLARAACFDCHSHETNYPWYANIAPVSWLVNKDINEGRREMNFSTGDDLEGGDMARQIQRGDMPLPIYLPLHPEANLTEAQKQALMDGLIATFGR
ncbi:MAG: heme-binding domain-containing protein [Chloroflexi bacterium]|nr:heme-binding domain-containing protein [Chloroflexota bacterium]MCC6897184.1 heme-binding domain-containing protein [Anaerolineae bacterium]